MGDAQPPDAAMGRNNITSWAESILRSGNESSPLLIAAILALPLLIVSTRKLISLTLDSREPPLLRPRIPFVGHVVNMITERTSWYKRLYDESSMPICTLPMLNGKMYVINSPDLISAALKNPDLSFDPFFIEFSGGMFGLRKEIKQILGRQDVIEGLVHVIHASLTGEPLHKLNIDALSVLMQTLNAIKPASNVFIPDVNDWLWNLVGGATLTGLYGPQSTLTSEHIYLFREFDRGVAQLSFGVLPQLLAPGPYRARSKLSEILEPYYAAGYDKSPDVSVIMRDRAEFLRERGYQNRDLGAQEISVPWVGTTNSIPALFWLFSHVFSDPKVVQRVRLEVENITIMTNSTEGRVAALSVRGLDEKCSFLYACYREVLRTYVHHVGNRRVMKDTILNDKEGRNYLLKKGTNVQWSTSVTHTLDSVWGEDASSFEPGRFLGVTAQDEKQRRGANTPFGGGKHLCPGRNFALAENLGLIGVLAAGFEVDGVHVAKSEDPILGAGIRQPVFGSQKCTAKIKRRKGWGDVTWRFVD